MSNSDEYEKIDEDKPLWVKNSLEAKKPEDTTYGDWVLKPGKPLSFRHRQFCILLAGGATNKSICEKLNVTSQWIAIIKSNKQIIAEIDRLQDRMFAENIEKRLKALGPYAADVIEQTLTSDDKEIKFDQKANMAKWLAEKLTGKASQEVKVEGNLLGNLMDQLDLMASQGKALASSGDVIDVSPRSGSQQTESGKKKDKWTSWIESNILSEGEGERGEDGKETKEEE